MVFSSAVFLFAFLPLFLAVYFILPWRPVKNIVLLLFSLLFYAWGEPVYVFLMIGSIIINWMMALIIDHLQDKRPRLGALVVALVIDIGILGVFKYETFVATNVNRVLGEGFLIDLQLALPIGISFFTLQAISYIVDVYRDKVKAQRNVLYLGMYIAMFPQLVAGPHRALLADRGGDRQPYGHACEVRTGHTPVHHRLGQEGALGEYGGHPRELAVVPAS